MKFLQGVALYSFAGWMIEGTYHKVTCGSFKRPHFSWLPFKPMYGIAAMLMIKCQKKGKWTAALGVSSIPALVEYISGYWLREHYGLQYWDYSQEKGNVYLHAVPDACMSGFYADPVFLYPFRYQHKIYLF